MLSARRTRRVLHIDTALPPALHPAGVYRRRSSVGASTMEEPMHVSRRVRQLVTLAVGLGLVLGVRRLRSQLE